MHIAPEGFEIRIHAGERTAHREPRVWPIDALSLPASLPASRAAPAESLCKSLRSRDLIRSRKNPDNLIENRRLDATTIIFPPGAGPLFAIALRFISAVTICDGSQPPATAGCATAELAATAC
ncbi:MAG: hypothetical protein KY475_23835, partial [Planctomycetes bacterium]|nr:hypothetical protein [Planctomycetota bacterium]